MADFVAVLRRTLDGLKDPSAEMREKVYDKARATIAAKLAAIDPPPPQSLIDRQNQALEAAIAEVEANYAAAEVDLDSEALDALLSDDIFDDPPRPARPVSSRETGARAASPAAGASPVRSQAAPAPERNRDPLFDDDDDDAGEDGIGWEEEEGDDDAPAIRRRRGRTLKGLLLALLVLFGIGGAGYALWQYKDPLLDLAGALVGPDTTPVATAPATPEVSGGEAEGTQEDAPADASGTRKFTQRLLEDGREVDPGPAQEEVLTGEGTSIASSSQSGQTTPPTPRSDPALAASSATQRAIFYEERTSNAQGSAEPGHVSWSLVEESPGGGLPPEPAIRGEATIPGKDIQFRMTIRRNGDDSLPASHIIEMIFLVPENFEGGAIDNVLRVALKESEQSPGNPLLGIPAKISDGFFLLALSDSNAEIQANNMMMRRLDWLDIPIVYRSGRRALITLEKGASGSRVFEEALRAWAPEPGESSQ